MEILSYYLIHGFQAEGIQMTAKVFQFLESRTLALVFYMAGGIIRLKDISKYSNITLLATRRHTVVDGESVPVVRVLDSSIGVFKARLKKIIH